MRKESWQCGVTERFHCFRLLVRFDENILNVDSGTINTTAAARGLATSRRHDPLCASI
jgi:hypothetical protein